MPPRPPLPTLFPYTTLFRSRRSRIAFERRLSGSAQRRKPRPMSSPPSVPPPPPRKPGGRSRRWRSSPPRRRSEEHTSELQSPCNLVCRLLLEKKKNKQHGDT